VPSLEEALVRQAPSASFATEESTVTVTVEDGVDMHSDNQYSCAFAPAPHHGKCNESGIAAAIKLATSSSIDVVVLALGNSEWGNGFTCHENKVSINRL
jgi:hypothetical protein